MAFSIREVATIAPFQISLLGLAPAALSGASVMMKNHSRLKLSISWLEMLSDAAD